MAVNTGYEGGNGESGKGEVFEHATRMVDEARAFGSALSGSMEDLSRAVDLRGRVERNPIGMVAAALGVGYVLGGGLFSPTTARLLRIGLRLALVPIIRSQINAFTEGSGERPSESGAI
ncbi:MAG TPA: hypothetical protein VG496_01245 [Myxococcales bacterium]|nr:hypothetical protein [Myxococcales bacterium]